MTKEKTEKRAEQIKVRILVGCHLGKANQVVTVSAEDLPGLAALVDSDPSAVTYAESLRE